MLNKLALAAFAAYVAVGGTPAKADATVPLAQCAMTGPGVAVCGGIAVVGHELVKLLNGQDAFGPNGEVVRAARTVWNDITKGPGPNNEFVRAGRTIANDLTHGPGENNDIVGRNGWLRKRLGF